jgi:alpha-beta hydrolase superfamily lysophospholipase
MGSPSTPAGCPTARGTVLIVHGLGEHAGRYAHVAACLDLEGWTVVGYDHRGHGDSEGPRGGLNRCDDLLADLALVIDAVRAEAAPAPLLLLGHSLGGLIAGRFVAEGLASAPASWWRAVDGLVLSSTALNAGMSAMQKLLLGVLGPLAPNVAVANGLKPEWISRDPAVVAAYVADPKVHDRITPKLARFIVDGGEIVQARAARWTLPTLLLSAGSDPCVAPAGSVRFAAGAPKQIVEAHAFDALFHEIFNEPEQSVVLATMTAWLARLFPPPTLDRTPPPNRKFDHERTRPLATGAAR